MSVKATFTFDCGGCDAVATADYFRIESRFHGFNGKDHGFGVYRTEWPDLEALAPEGWVVFDPYTRCTYCPKCWAEICSDQGPEQGEKQ